MIAGSRGAATNNRSGIRIASYSPQAAAGDPATLRQEVDCTPPSRKITWLPLLLAVVWMLGTFGAFWLTGISDFVENPGELCAFILGSTAIFAAGYALRMWRRPPIPTAPVDSVQKIRKVRRLVVASAFYYATIALSQLAIFGATSPMSIWQSIQNPADGYLNKFEVFQYSAASSSPLLTLLFPFGVLSTALAPLMVIYWRDLFGWPRILGLTGLILHVSFYLFIGTMKGVGDIVIMLVGGILITTSVLRRRQRTTSPRRRALMAIAAVFGILVAYMIHNHGSRDVEFGTTNALLQVNPDVEAALGQEAAEGITNVIIYPTHGYLGLSYNLQSSFEWSYGLGSAPAAAMFAEDNFGISRPSTYPERTENQEGWPAQLYWATIYPWLASDLTFPGTIFFMGVIGWLLASSWSATVSHRRIVPTLIFTQLCLLIAYIPANNQLGMSPESVVGMITLLALYLNQSAFSHDQKKSLRNGTIRSGSPSALPT